METQPNSGGTGPRIPTATTSGLNRKHFIDLVPGDIIVRPHSSYTVEVASVERPSRARKRVTVTFTNGEHYTHYDSYWATMAPVEFSDHDSREWECPQCYHIYRASRHEVGACPFCDRMGQS